MIHLKLTLKVSLSIFLVSVLAFSLLQAGFIVLQGFAYLYSETTFSETCLIENTFETPTSKVTKIDTFDKLVFTATILRVETVPLYTPNLVALSRAPPYNLCKLDSLKTANGY